MRRLFVLVLAALLICGVAQAAVNTIPTPASRAVIYRTATGSPITEAATVIVPVRYGNADDNAPSLASGDVVIWDTTSADGITISGCITDNAVIYAGVLVTTIATADVTDVTANARNIGFMAIHGFCLAKVDTSESTTGALLLTNGGTQSASFGTTDLFGGTVGTVSRDIGILLRDDASDGLMPVWLY